MNYQKHIVINPEKRFGKPCIKGTRITVYDVLRWFSIGMTMEEILQDYEELTREDILACLSYASEKERRITVLV
ncbi:MAG: DUF433 domain-containing protein [Microscillaceae bacterium]|nr:DUF433 domain-containing protein [Microscillaceae bacterium]